MRFFLLGWIVRVKVWFTILIVAVIVTIREFDIILSLTECTEDTEFYYLSPTDNTDFLDFLPSGYNDSLFDFVKNRSTDYTDTMRIFISN